MPRVYLGSGDRKMNLRDRVHALITGVLGHLDGQVVGDGDGHLECNLAIYRNPRLQRAPLQQKLIDASVAR